MAVAGTARRAAPTTEALWARPEMPTPPSSAASSAATAPPSAEPVPPTIWVRNSTLRVRRWTEAGSMVQEYPSATARQTIDMLRPWSVCLWDLACSDGTMNLSGLDSPRAPVPERLADALTDRYVIERVLGRGGMATVYVARDRKHDRPVAVKVLHPEMAATLSAERFQREIRVAARLQHPHILPVYDSGAGAGLLWFTMPFVEGESLRDRLRREGPLPVADAVNTLEQVARALGYAHRAGVMHRDVKPENVLLGRDQVFLSDFGIAKPIE